jgi:hypothetical protein
VSGGATVTPSTAKSSSEFPVFGRNRDGDSTRPGHRPGGQESQADLERFEKWLTGIGDGSYFKTAGGAEAGSAVQRCREAEAAFETAAHRRRSGRAAQLSVVEGPRSGLAADNADDENSGVANSRLRIVKDQLWPVIRGLRC